MFALELTLWILAIGILIPMGVFCAECLASVLFGRRRNPPWGDLSPRTVVLIPAHNEASVMEDTLTRLLPTLRETDRVLVIADNCSDDTATIARYCGAEVLERFDAERRGKPFALQLGLQHLQSGSPDVIVFLDADCRVDSQTVRRISSLAHQRNRPVQALNLCQAERGDSAINVVSELGFRFKNLVRPLGFSRLGLPCHLMGTGMALPWGCLQHATFGGDDLAEDMQFGIDLALKGSATIFCPDVAINSALPSGKQAMIGQRTRWEQGHLHTMLTQMPRLLCSGLLRLRPSLLFLAMDLTVPPLSLLVVIWIAGLLVATFAAFCGATTGPAIAFAIAGLGMTSSLLAGWFIYCREQIPFRSLLGIPRYVLEKVPIYRKFFFGGRQREWLRTERCEEERRIRPGDSMTLITSESRGKK